VAQTFLLNLADMKSRCRTVLVWVLINQVFHIKTGATCEVLDNIRAVPLSSPKSLWEARSRSAWEKEYEVYNSMKRTSPDLFGELIDACKQSNVGTNRQKLDSWNSTADNLGILLGLTAATL